MAKKSGATKNGKDKKKAKKQKKAVEKAVARAHSLMAIIILAKELGAIMRRESRPAAPIRESPERSSAS